MISNIFVVYAEILLALGILTLYNFGKEDRFSRYIWFAFMMIPVTYFYSVIFSYTDNIPFKDDYVLLESILNMDTALSLSDFLKSFLQQVNQHRFGFERAIMWLIYKILGNENIKVQIIIGNLFLLGILYLLFRQFKNLNLSYAYFTPVPLILFNLTYFENATWGIAAIQNTPIIFFAFLTVHFLISPKNNSFLWAIISATITLFTSGNGVAIWLVGVFILTIQRRWKPLGIWIMLTILLFALYFLFDYEIIPSERANLIRHPLLNIQYVLAFWGNVFFQNIPHPDVGRRYLDVLFCMLIGIFLLIIILGLLGKVFKKLPSKNAQPLLIFGGMAFLACTGLMLVFSRPLEVNIMYGGEILSRRYMIFGATFLCLGYTGCLLLIKSQKSLLNLGFICFLCTGLFVNINSYYTSLSDVIKQKSELRLDGYYWKNHTMLLTFGEKYQEKMGYNHPTYMINLINKLDSSGIYRLSQTEILPLINQMEKLKFNQAKVFNGTIDTTMSIATTIAREQKPKILFKGTSNSRKKNIEYIALKSQTNTFLFPAIKQSNSIKACLLTQSIFGREFEYEIWREKLPSGFYEIWVIEKDVNNQTNLLYCQKVIQI